MSDRPNTACPPGDDQEAALLQALSRQFPTVDSAVSEIARLSGELMLPKGTIHIISDIHGEDAKLRHVLNNASGMLRPRVEALFRDQLTPQQIQEFLKLLFYPKETLAFLEPQLNEEGRRREFAERTLSQLSVLLRALAARSSLTRCLGLLPADYRSLLQELLHDTAGSERGEAYLKAVADSLVTQQRLVQVIRATVRMVRNLAIDELIIAGDCWDRGPRGDRVVEYLRRQPNVAITWGNHDAAWLGACLGQEALIAHVLRISLRYGRLAQLEEGYGIPLQPLEQLANTMYANDSAECYRSKGNDPRDPLLLARMQKAVAIMQFKLEGQTIERNPHFGMDHRRLLHTIDYEAGTIVIDGRPRPLRDRQFPTISPRDPYVLSPEERACLDRLRESLIASQRMWEHMRFLVGRGAMWLKRDDHLIFHGCIAVDERGDFLPLVIDGVERRGRELFDAFERIIVRVMDHPADADRDWLWYLWCGPRSPLFGKDRIATLEIDLVADPSTHAESKNPYFHLIHDPAFCDKVLMEFGVDARRGLIVNGHVPVKIDQGESPVKKSGKAITIDGAFSEAYGDHGYTLVLEPERTMLAEHHHFDSAETAVREGTDIMPKTSVIRHWQPPRLIADTERGQELRAQIALLERLVAAYRRNKLRQDLQ